MTSDTARSALLPSFGVLLLAVPAVGETIRVHSADCSALIRHVATPDAAYQPGVDVRGEPVVPADVGGLAMALPEVIDLVIGIDLADCIARRDGKTGRALLPASGEAKLGVLTIKGGATFWNGERIGPGEEAALAESCRTALAPPKESLPTAKPDQSAGRGAVDR
jgi:hypothetical protein